ncbi:MAG: Abi family protein [Proteobacteria bacterium]|nr:Abi family protein [Pseudomonadota bacterium]
MKYTKLPLSFSEQVALLQQRGMQGDPAEIEKRLQTVNYYRLSGYWYPFRIPGHNGFPRTDTFHPGTNIKTVWERYVFDRALRLLIMDAVERIEIAVRTKIAYHHAHEFQDPFAYATNPASLDHEKRQALLQRIATEVRRSREPFIQHYLMKYTDSKQHLPIWMATEVLSMGTILNLYNASPRHVCSRTAELFKIPPKVLSSWLLTLNTVRNICAHHGRLWNRELGTKPKIPKIKKYPEWHIPVSISGNRIFGVLTICAYCLQCIPPHSRWKKRLHNLLHTHPDIPLTSMGFPENWLESPLWRAASEDLAVPSATHDN